MMVRFNSVLFAGAALLAGAQVGQAADLPMAEPVEYVKVCDAFGSGFFYIPGSDTCLQISGYARLDINLTEYNNRQADKVSWLARGRVNFDARTQTEYGELRSYIRFQIDRFSGPGVGGALLDRAFIEFAGLTAGYTTSFFDFYANANLFGTVAGSDQTIPLVAYTAKLSEQFTATLSFEDKNYREYGLLPTGYAGQSLPDVVGQLKYETDAITAQVSAAVHQVKPLLGNFDTEYGWAVLGGISFAMPTGEDDTLYLQGIYGEGTTSYLTTVTYNGLFDPALAEAEIVGGNTRLSTNWAVTGEYLHYWTGSLRSVFAGSYAQVDYPAAGVKRDLETIVGTGSLIWSPVKNLDLGFEVGYSNIKQEVNLPRPGREFDKWAGIVRVERQF